MLTSKTINFLTPAQQEQYLTNKNTSTSASIDQSQTALAAGTNSDNQSMEGVEGHDKPSALES